MKFAIWAIPPTRGIFSDLKPRFQMWNNGEIVIYDCEEQAQDYVKICVEEKSGWFYFVKEI